MSNLLMDREQTVQLIQAYGSHRLLWDTGDARHFHRALRARAWRAIAAALRAPVPELKKKLESLMGSYRREKSRERQSIMAGLGPDDAYKSKWYGYEHFHFMSEKSSAGAAGTPPARITHETLDGIKIELEHYEDEDAEQQAAFTDEQAAPLSPSAAAPLSPSAASPPPRSPRPKRRRRSRREPAEHLLEECLRNDANRPQNGLDPSQDPYYSFGIYIASELRKYDDATLSHVKHAISNIIFEADMGRYARAAAAKSPAAEPPAAVARSRAASVEPPDFIAIKLPSPDYC